LSFPEIGSNRSASASSTIDRRPLWRRLNGDRSPALISALRRFHTDYGGTTPVNSIRDASIILAAGVAGTFFFGRPVLRTWRAMAWPAAPGTVTSAKVEERPSGTAGSGYRYAVIVKYRYEVRGAEHTGDRILFCSNATTFRSPQTAGDLAKRYAKGTKVDVHYDPKAPAESVADPAVPWHGYASAGFSALFLLLGIVGTVRILLHQL
jgi:hypothetical protein